MTRALSSLLLAVAIAAPAAAATPAATRPDADVVKGIKQVEDGEYDSAIVTLDTAARRLQAAGNSKDLAQAYLYLGIAFVGKGQETAARARFRDAIAQARDMDLSAAKFPPKVIELFEKAKEESRGGKSGGSGGGSSKGLLIGGGVVAAGGVAALVLAGGGDDGGSGGAQTVTGTVGGAGNEQSFLVVTPTKPGTLEANLSWTTPGADLAVGCQEQDPPYTGCDGQLTRPNTTSAILRVNVQAKSYLMVVSNYRTSSEGFTLTVRLP
jgi:hypothetical protein